MGQVTFDLGYLLLDTGYQLVGLVFVEFQDALHLDFHQLQDVVTGHFPDELWLEGRQLLVHEADGLVHVFGRFEAFFLVDALLYEDALQRGEE